MEPDPTFSNMGQIKSKTNPNQTQNRTKPNQNVEALFLHTSSLIIAPPRHNDPTIPARGHNEIIRPAGQKTTKTRNDEEQSE